ncbi:MAG: YhfG family protein [Methylococcales symbiont of Hymedesmia sp. n. MRB-2018]|nr:MAG: YhfG family protein [Methylococcales symbiont of Hymedesmia sp. n. MRB-2018]KAF3983838.1 MAG: YhfG family protein [Methylococcales symbiont of Hymedesmia sp. n. MRB-2018]
MLKKSKIYILSLFKRIQNFFFSKDDEEKISVISSDEKTKIFDERRYASFVNSSKLEGVNITPVNETIEELKRKYESIGKNSNYG